MSFENNEQKRLALASRRGAGTHRMLQAFFPDVLALVDHHNVEHDGKETPPVISKMFRNKRDPSGLTTLIVLVIISVSILAVAVLVPLPRWN